jgi:hypothetical protein
MSALTRRTLSTRVAFAAGAGLAAAAARPLSSLAQATPAATGAVAKPVSALDPAAALARIAQPDGALRFDVAEDATRFLFAPQPLHDDGMPAYGNAFVTQGYIFPEGTLDEANGLTAEGQPEFADDLLGEWTCRGWFVGDGALTATGPWVITTQLLGFGDAWGEATLVSEGYEISDIGVEIVRAITGGTGVFAGARGQGSQTLLGFNATEGVNLRFALAPIGVAPIAMVAPRNVAGAYVATANYGGDN